MREKTRFVMTIAIAAMIGSLFGPSISGAIVPGTNPTPDEVLAYVPVTACALHDTRPSVALPGTTFTGVKGETQDVIVAGTAACPAIPADAAAVSAVVTAINPQVNGNFRFYQKDTTEDISSTGLLTFDTDLFADESTFNVNVGTGGKVVVENNSVGAVDMRFTVIGYWAKGTDVFESFDRTIVVGGAGTPAENGSALDSAITAANSLSPSATSPVLIKLEPGTFQYSFSSLSLPGNVHLEGSGPDATIIERPSGQTLTVNGVGGQVTAISDLTMRSNDGSTSTIVVNAAAELIVRDARIEKTNTGSNGTAIYSTEDVTIRIERSEIRSFGSSVETIFMEDGELSVVDSHVEAQNGSAIFVCCQETVGEEVSIDIRGSLVRSNGSAISGDGDEVSFTINNSTMDGNISADFAKVVRNSTVLGALSGAGPETCVGVSTATTFFTNTCP